MKFRIRLAAWFGFSLAALIALLMFTAHRHLDEELRRDSWDRSHPGYPGWVIHGSFTDEEVHDILGELMQVWLWVGTPAVLAALGIGFLLARRSVRPIHQINRELSSLDPGSLQKGIAVPEHDPVLSDLVQHINSLLERAGAAYRNLDEFASKVSHELRTPLMLLRMKIERSAADLPPGFSEELQEQLARMSRLVDRSLLAAKAESGHVNPELAETDLTVLLEDIRNDYELLAEEKGLELRWDVKTGAVALTDAGLLRQVLHNLIGNAFRYAKSGVRLRARCSNDAIVVGIANDVDQISMPETGTGLGLRLVRSLSSALSIRFRQKLGRSAYVARLEIPFR